MIERIEIVSATEVRIQRLKGGGSTVITCYSGAWTMCNCGSWDALGQAALRDCINCLEATGSFAALAETSAVPFVGKRMRRKWGPSPANIMLVGKWVSKFGTKWSGYVGGGGALQDIEESDLLPLIDPTPPKPTVRPWKKEQAAAHINRHVVNPQGTSAPWIELVYGAGVVLSTGVRVTFEELTRWRFDGTQTMCGVVEPVAAEKG